MAKAVYNSGILDVALNSLPRAVRGFTYLRTFLCLVALMLGATTSSAAADWNTTEQNLARKILAVTGQASITVTFENRSSLNKRDSDIIANGLRSVMQAAGVRFVTTDQASASITISLSENLMSYIWIAQIRPNGSDPVVVMVSSSRPEGSAARDSVPLNLRKIPLYAQGQPILDVAVLEEASSPTRIAVLDPEKISWYRMQNGRWEAEKTLGITHEQPWPRDLRGRLVRGSDQSLNAYLPGVFCTSNAQSTKLDCRQSDDPWPLLPGPWNGTLAVFPGNGLASGASTLTAQPKAFFAPARNYFTGALTAAIGKFTTVPKFFSATLLPRDNGMLWLFAETDGHVHMIDGVSDQIVNVSWGSDLASVKTTCGAEWQVLATTAGEQASDSIRAYEFPDREPAPVSSEIEFDGVITALWTESRGDMAVAVSRNQETGTYEAFRLAMACGQ